MIPKKIHYCWFGRGELPELAKRCIASWKKYCPDFEIIQWNEDNFDINVNAYTRMCYRERKYAFLSDYVRLVVLEKHGGVYFDTDVELISSIDDLLEHQAWFGFEDDSHINTGVGFATEPGQACVRAMLAEYEPLLGAAQGTIGCPLLNTQALVRMGLVLNGAQQNVSGAMVFPQDWFNPYDDPTGLLNTTVNTRSIHWYSKSWLSRGQILRSRLTRPFHRIFGKDCFKWLKT